MPNNLRDFQETLRKLANIPDDFVEASDHPYTCTCDICRDWWEQMGPDDNGTYGPFGKTLPPKREDA